nr:hypothetical protein [Tanacetum cinerariifolium]
MGYSFYYPPKNKVLVAWNAEFLENSLISQEASGSLKDLEIIQEEDTHPAIDTSFNHEEDDLEIDEPQSDTVPIRWSTRTRHASDRMCLYIDVEDHELGDLGEPANYKATLLNHEFEKWLNAMNVEMQSMNDNEVWVLFELHPNGKIIGSIMYDVRCTRLDVALAQNVTSRFQQNPSDLYWITVKNILKYLRNTKDMFLVYGEAEYIAASKEAIWVRKFIFRQGVVPTIEEPISMYYDNTAAIAIANELGITKGARHFCVKVHYLREVIEYGDIKLEKVHAYDNLADPFTKTLAFPKPSEYTRNIGMLPASSLMYCAGGGWTNGRMTRVILGDEQLSTTSEIESDKVTKSSVKNLVPIPSEYEVTFDDESECDVSVKDESSPIFTTFSNPIFDDNDDFTYSDDELLSNEDVPMEDFKVYLNFLFDDEEINSNKIDPHYFNAESDLIESLSNRDTLFDSYSMFDYIEEFSGKLMLPGIENDDYHSGGDIHIFENCSKMILLPFLKMSHLTLIIMMIHHFLVLLWNHQMLRFSLSPIRVF